MQMVEAGCFRFDINRMIGECMKIATLLFTYNRSEHTKKVLESLKQNTVLPERLYIFQDGLKIKAHGEEWKRVNECIRQVDFCPVEIVVSERNKGLADSIVSGINYAFENFDAVIVLEDDCVPTPGFMQFMIQCFERYEKEKKVYSVSGYAWPISVESVEHDAYFCGRFCSWGWGTWKDRWVKYERNYDLLRDIRNNAEASRRLSQWSGKSTVPILLGNIHGNIDSWAVFWGLRIVVDDGLCINPYRSLIENIGCDGSGEHCGTSNVAKTRMQEKEIAIYRFPMVQIDEKVREAFQQLYGDYYHREGLTRTLIWGIGNLYNCHKEDLLQKVTVAAFIDSFKKFKYFEGKRVIKEQEIPEFDFEQIIIEIADFEEAQRIKEHLIHRYKISEKCIWIDQ